MDSRRVGLIIAELLDSHNVALQDDDNSASGEVDEAEDTEATQGPPIHTVSAGVPMMPGTGTMATGAVLTPSDVSDDASSNVLFESWVLNALSVHRISHRFPDCD